MAYDLRKIGAFGATGIVVAAMIIFVFLPTQQEVRVNPIVALQEIPGYGVQLVKITDEPVNILHLNLTIDGFEIKLPSGDWAEVDGGKVSFNLLRDHGTSVSADVGNLDPGNYSMIRFSIVRGLEYTNATLDDGEVIIVDVPSLKVEIETQEFEIAEGLENVQLSLRIKSGTLSNYKLPQYQIALGTMKIEVSII
jgi:hypothetical protein